MQCDAMLCNAVQFNARLAQTSVRCLKAAVAGRTGTEPSESGNSARAARVHNTTIVLSLSMYYYYYHYYYY